MVELYKKTYSISINYLITPKLLNAYTCPNCNLTYFLPAIVGDSDFYKNLHLKMNDYYPSSKNEFDIAHNFINPNSKVLEIGAGSGMFYNKIKNKCLEYLGIEISKEAVEQAKKEKINIQLIPLEEVAEKFSDYFDAVVSFQVMEHIPVNVLNSTLKLSTDCLKTNGYLIMSVPSNDSYLKCFSNFSLNLPPHHQTRWSNITFNRIEELFDLKLIKIVYDPFELGSSRLWFRTILKSKISNKCYLIDKRWLLNKIVAYIDKIFNINGVISKKLAIRYRPLGYRVTVIFQKN